MHNPYKLYILAYAKFKTRKPKQAKKNSSDLLKIFIETLKLL